MVKPALFYVFNHGINGYEAFGKQFGCLSDYEYAYSFIYLQTFKFLLLETSPGFKSDNYEDVHHRIIYGYDTKVPQMFKMIS